MKPEEKWLSNDYEIMIKLKQYNTKKAPAIPSKLKERKARWAEIKFFPDPPELAKPAGYQEVVVEIGDIVEPGETLPNGIICDPHRPSIDSPLTDQSGAPQVIDLMNPLFTQDELQENKNNEDRCNFDDYDF